MLIGEILAVALQSIRANALRSFLTMLGIIIGVGAVITMVALGSGAQRAVEERIAALGANVLHRLRRAGQPRRRHDHRPHDPEHRRLRGAGPRRQAAQGRRARDAADVQVQYGNQNRNLQIIGTTSNYVDGAELHRRPTAGCSPPATTTPGSATPCSARRSPTCSAPTPPRMIHQTITIRGIPFEVIGVLSEKGAAGGFSNPDEQILIPLDTARYRVFGSNRLALDRGRRWPTACPLEQGMVDLERVLRREHRIRPGEPNDFTIRNQRDILETQQQATQVFTTLLASIAAVSLVVGGIGIMNIMLVSVTERTREIGVRKALGATRLNILLQFLIEALALCLIGGVLGILLGTGAATVLAARHALEHAHLAGVHRHRVRLQRAGGALLRHLARAPRGAARPDRRAAIRVSRVPTRTRLTVPILRHRRPARRAGRRRSRRSPTRSTAPSPAASISPPRGSTSPSRRSSRCGTASRCSA